jgi:hypothetical protein
MRFWQISHLKQKYSYLNDDERGSSASTASGYGLDDLAIEIRSPAEAKQFFV